MTEAFKKKIADEVFTAVAGSVVADDQIEKVEFHRTDDLNGLIRVVTREATGPYRSKRRDFTVKFSEMY